MHVNVGAYIYIYIYKKKKVSCVKLHQFSFMHKHNIWLIRWCEC